MRIVLAIGVLAGVTGLGGTPSAPTTAPATTPTATTAGSRTIHVTGGGAGFDVTLPGTSVATFTWHPGDPVAQETLTAADGTNLTVRGARQPDVPLTTATSSSAVPVSVDPTQTFQTMAGFGGAMTDAAATLIDTSPHRDEILDALFGDAGTSARLDLVRVPVGATDLVASSYGSYDDQPAGGRDPMLRHFSIAHDLTHTVPVLQDAAARRPDLQLLGTPWSAPGWMKYGGTFTGTCGTDAAGHDLDTLRPRYDRAYAHYFVRFAKAYAHRGLPVSMMSLQNEPQTCRTDYPTMTLTAAREARLARFVRARLDRRGLTGTGLLGWDHNYYDEGATAGATPTAYPDQLLGTGNGHGAIAAIGYHCYNNAGNASAYTTQTARVPTYVTECSGSYHYPDAATNLVNEVRDDLLGPIRAGARGSYYWSLAQGTDGGPHVGGCDACRGLVGIDRATGAWAPNEDYWYWSQLSRFVAPGAVRIASSDPGHNLQTVAFRNPDGGTVLVVLNAAWPGSQHGHLVQSSADTSSQKAAWLVGPDGRRRSVPDTATYACLKAGGAPGPGALSPATLDTLPVVPGGTAVCGGDRLVTGSMLTAGFAARSASGATSLRLSVAALTLQAADGHALWSTGVGGDDLVLQDDGNLVEQRDGAPVWASGTAGSGAVAAVVHDDALVLTAADGSVVWSS